MMGLISAAHTRFTRAADLTTPAALLFARLVLATVFWRAGLQKVETFDLLGLRLPLPIIKEDTLFLFSDEFFPGLVPEACFDDPDAAGCGGAFFFTDTLAVMGAIGELTLPVLVTLGLFTRVGALGLLVMTLVIQLFVFPTWGHWMNPAMWWAAVAAVLIAHGGGAWSLDRVLGVETARER